MLSRLPDRSPERRREERRGAGGFPLLTPASATIVDCAARGLGIETSAHLAVGSLTSVQLFVPGGEMELEGRVCWARMVSTRDRGDGEAEPVFRAGLAFVEDQPLDAWERLRKKLALPPGRRRRAVRPRRRVVRWRRPRSG